MEQDGAYEREREKEKRGIGYRCGTEGVSVCLSQDCTATRGGTGLENGATFPLGATASLDKRCTGSVFKHLANSLAGLGRAFEVANGTDLLGNSHTLFGRDGALTRLSELLDNLGVMAKILFASDEDDGQVLAEVEHFRDPLFLDVVERVG